MRSQVRKISMLSSGIRGLQAKMQVLREETNRSIEQSEDIVNASSSLRKQILYVERSANAEDGIAYLIELIVLFVF